MSNADAKAIAQQYFNKMDSSSSRKNEDKPASEIDMVQNESFLEQSGTDPNKARGGQVEAKQISNNKPQEKVKSEEVSEYSYYSENEEKPKDESDEDYNEDQFSDPEKADNKF